MESHQNLCVEISDLGLASALACLSFRIEELDRSNPRRVVFRFDASQHGIQEAVDDYWNGNLRLPPAPLFTHQRLLKQRIYSENT